MSNEELLAKIGQPTEETEFYTPMPRRLSAGPSQVRHRRRHRHERPGQGHLLLLARQAPPGQRPQGRPHQDGRLSTTSTPARSTPTAMAKSSSSTTAWKPTWTWAPTSACSTRTSRPPTSPPTARSFAASSKKERQGSYLGRDVQIDSPCHRRSQTPPPRPGRQIASRRRLRRSRRHRRRLRKRLLPRSLPPTRL